MHTHVPFVLALEPDHRQASVLKRVIRDRVHAELMVVDSRDAAIAATSARIPDVILLTALLSPRDEQELISHLRGLAGAEHVQTHTIPQLASSSQDSEPGQETGGLFGKLRRKKNAEPIPGCDPSAFADEVGTFIAHAAEKKAQAALQPRPVIDEPRRDKLRGHEHHESTASVDDSAAEQPAADAGSAWASPFEWRRSDSAGQKKKDTAPRKPLVTNAPLAVVAEEEEARRAESDRRAREEAARERERLEAEAADRRERERVEAEAAAQREHERAEAEAAAKRERERLQAEQRAKEEAARRAKEEAEHRAKEEAARRERERLEAERRAKEEAERRAKEEAARRAKEEAERRAKAEAERRAKEEAERRAKEEAARRAKEEAERRAKEEAERRAKEEAAKRERLEAERRAKEEAERRAKEEAARRAKEEAERRAKEEAERAARRAKEEAERRAKEEADRRAKEETERRAKEAAERRAKEEAARLERERLEAEAAAERERLRVEAEAAEQDRRRREAEEADRRAAAEREADEEIEIDLNHDPFADFRDGEEREDALLKLMPITAWARTGDTKRQAASDSNGADDLHHLIAGLSIPSHVAGIAYARGCRIRRVRVPAPRPAARSRIARPVILSKRALEEARNDQQNGA